MERTPLNPTINPDLTKILQYIMDEALGSVIQLSSDPTTAGAELKINQVGFNPTTSRLFFNLFGTTYRVALTAV